jgi:hypothetical protein
VQQLQGLFDEGLIVSNRCVCYVGSSCISGSLPLFLVEGDMCACVHVLLAALASTTLTCFCLYVDAHNISTGSSGSGSGAFSWSEEDHLCPPECQW